ncbi:hypothetical protein A2673_01110 [Candidatus Kaiserbacteria bacterium RIFCSPHIGHO2_01_FULL_50_13]|uniref:Uncharacterized protein n=1 Tax=Candidatus Kaiserbacteria bacterium RIFCSPLOWO2_01_FULL_50_24 TaxID=1798507 RepID=A0A1F6EP31_9BACT|nr:MAG: hypothetical protein A2673_01110 [Candidatus Kaiserbacteria bacterium RIFCSPHIGHO2_01_FULL_50_13]OGG75102.1 MAG: hypothetical protein A3A34_01960 [Candidatus Kaiserbacteria bacterium RIFCSPLOWO2_01_FULL_50_24]OGG82144.1 MAG: hypothetical protein A3H74_00390 [Candidatus Kaiserbacteria bacterium RIFCSPLOWO2_02_FULL_51_13]
MKDSLITIRVVILFTVLFSVALVGVDAVYADSTGLTIQPVKISKTIGPGESISGEIILKNESEGAASVEVTVEDFVPAAGSTNIQFVGRAEGVTTVRDWITLDAPDSFVFGKGQSRNITYTIRAPSHAEPGGHFGVVFFKASDANEQGQLKVGTRVGVLVFITVPGNQLQSGNVLDFSGPFFVQKGPVEFTIKFENTGTVHFEPKGTITITNIFGKEVGVVEVAGQAVLPTGVRDLAAAWNAEGLLIGRYVAEINIVDGEGRELTANRIAFYAFPILYVIAFLITIIVLFFGIKFIRKNIKISIWRK